MSTHTHTFTHIHTHSHTGTHLHTYTQAQRHTERKTWSGLGNSSWLYFRYGEVGRVDFISAASAVCQPSASGHICVYKAAATVQEPINQSIGRRAITSGHGNTTAQSASFNTRFSPVHATEFLAVAELLCTVYHFTPDAHILILVDDGRSSICGVHRPLPIAFGAMGHVGLQLHLLASKSYESVTIWTYRPIDVHRDMPNVRVEQTHEGQQFLLHVTGLSFLFGFGQDVSNFLAQEQGRSSPRWAI